MGALTKPVKSHPRTAMGCTTWRATSGESAMLDLGRNGDKYRAAGGVERTVLGGWLRSAPHLRCGFAAHHSPGVRHPDGFRPVRGPAAQLVRHAGSTAGRRPRRRVRCLELAVLMGDAASTGPAIYRTTRRDTAGFRVNEKPTDRPTFPTAPPGRTCCSITVCGRSTLRAPSPPSDGSA
jgi:hypothetical protein